MKTLPGIKIAVFFTLVFAVALGVYAQMKDIKVKKPRKYVVRFGWSETSAYTLDAAPHTADAIKSYLDGINGTQHSYRLKAQQYKDSKPEGDPVGDFDMCLPTEGTAMSGMRSSSAATPQAAPSSTPSGAKTQSAGYAQLETPALADTFADWVNNP